MKRSKQTMFSKEFVRNLIREYESLKHMHGLTDFVTMCIRDTTSNTQKFRSKDQNAMDSLLAETMAIYSCEPMKDSTEAIRRARLAEKAA